MSSMNKRATAENRFDFWEKRRGKIFSRRGGWIIGEAIYNCGYSMMDDLVGKASFFQVLVLNVTGRLPERRLADWLEAVYICMSWPDARIWCNQIGSLAGTMRASCVAAVCAGVQATDSPLYGVAPLRAGTHFIVEALALKKQGLTAEDIVERQCRRPGSKPTIVGYARPVATGDERVVALERVTAELGYERGEHLSLAFDIDAVLHERYGERMNIVGYVTGFMSDLGFSVEEICRIFTTVVNSGVHACYAEAAEQPPESFFPLRCEDIDYQGHPPRPVPDPDRGKEP